MKYTVPINPSENGVKVAESIQSDPEVFIGKDSSNSEKTDQID
jgi:hypothetical protein